MADLGASDGAAQNSSRSICEKPLIIDDEYSRKALRFTLFL